MAFRFPASLFVTIGPRAVLILCCFAVYSTGRFMFSLAILTYGRNAKMTFCVFMSQERHKPFLGMFIFIMGVSPSNFVVVSFLLTSLRKGYFLRQRIRRYRFLKAGTAVLLVLNILLLVSTRISIRNRFLYDGWMDKILSV